MSKINHAPKFYVRLCQGKSVSFPDNFAIFPGSLYGRYTSNNKRIFWVCDNYNYINDRLQVHFYNGAYWKIEWISSAHPVYKWVKSALSELGKIPKIDRDKISFDDAKNLMRHDRLHKKGSGSRINNHSINPPLKWNEITEIAHWYGKGNASVVACNIRQ